MKRPAPRSKEATHERIVDVAARAIRRSGYHGTGVADIMKAAGLTHGGFYAHFESRDALLAEAAERAGRESEKLIEKHSADAPPERALQAVIATYLSEGHLKAVETGCPLAALGTEVPRQAPEVRRVATRRINELIDLIARKAPDRGQPGARERAVFTTAAMIGTLILARASNDPELSDALRHAALHHLDPQLN